MDRINEITSECFVAAQPAARAGRPPISPELIHDRLQGFVESMRARAREQGMSGRDADDMAYAIVALADEVAMGKPDPLRGYWMGRPLQLCSSTTTLAGEGFFTRLAESAAIRGAPTCCASTTSACCSASRASTRCGAATSS